MALRRRRRGIGPGIILVGGVLLVVAALAARSFPKPSAETQQTARIGNWAEEAAPRVSTAPANATWQAYDEAGPVRTNPARTFSRAGTGSSADAARPRWGLSARGTSHAGSQLTAKDSHALAQGGTLALESVDALPAASFGALSSASLLKSHAAQVVAADRWDAGHQPGLAETFGPGAVVAMLGPAPGRSISRVARADAGSQVSAVSFDEAAGRVRASLEVHSPAPGAAALGESSGRSGAEARQRVAVAYLEGEPAVDRKRLAAAAKGERLLEAAVSPVPEPEVWAMQILGLVLFVGVMAARRRSASS